MTGTKGERQGRKERKRGKGNRNVSIIQREECYIWHACRGSAMNSYKFMTVNNKLRE